MSLERMTCPLNEAEVEVLFDHTPEEPAEKGPEAQYPGCKAEVEVHAIYLEGVNIYTAICPDEVDNLSNYILKNK